jgi:hypothetical protein
MPNLDSILEKARRARDNVKDTRAYMRRWGEDTLSAGDLLTMIEECSENIVDLADYLRDKNGHYVEPNETKGV